MHDYSPTLLPTTHNYTAHLGKLPAVGTWIAIDHYPLPQCALRPLFDPDTPHRLITARIHTIVPTQARVNRAIVAYYLNTHRHVESGGSYPVGIRYLGDSAIYLTNGHHRLIARKLTGKTHTGLWVYFADCTLEQAATPTRSPIPIHALADGLNVGFDTGPFDTIQRHLPWTYHTEAAA